MKAFLNPIPFICSYLLLLLPKTIKNQSTMMDPSYNFGNHQNHEIDLLFNHLLGQNVYFIHSDADGHTQFSTTLYPSLSLEMQFKFYTNNTKIINALQANQILFLGIDLNITNTDIIPTYAKYKTDVIGCELTFSSVQCDDYVFDTIAKTYQRNKNGAICKNNLVPMGFSEINVNILKQNVINYEHYYSIQFQKMYPPNFDNITMFNWINYVASDMDHFVSAFFNVDSPSSKFDSFTETQMNYLNLKYADGTGLSDGNYYLRLQPFIIIISMILYVFI